MAFIIQVHRCGEWRRLTRVAIPESRNGDKERARRKAQEEVRRQIDGWSGYFAGLELRAVEVAR